jgi:hypothetical protein
MTVRDSGRNVRNRLVTWMKRVITGEEGYPAEPCRRGIEDLEWLKRLNPAINELLDVLQGAPEEIRDGVLNYTVTRMFKNLHPNNNLRLKNFMGAHVKASLEQRRLGVTNNNPPQKQGYEPVEDKTTESQAYT